MTIVRPTPLTYLNCSHSPVTAPLCPTPGQDAKSMLNPALRTTEIRDYPEETEVLAAQTKAGATVFNYLQPSARLQSP
jgi:hypothetical protein